MKKSHKLLSLTMGLIFSFGALAACGPQTPTTTLNYDLTETNEKITYNFFSPGFTDLAENDSVVAHIEEKFNVDIKFDGGAFGDWEKALAGLVSSNKAPDLFFALPDSSTMSDYTRKVLTDYDYYLDNAGDKLPNLKAMLNAEPFGNNIKINGKYYFIPKTVGTTTRAILVRKDWMKQWNESKGRTGEAALTEPRTLSEFTDMLTYFHENSLGGGKTYGMAIGIDAFDFYRDFMATFGIEPDLYLDESGNYQYSAISHPNYDAFVNWFKDGVGTYIDKALLDGQSASDAIVRFHSGDVGALICNTVGVLDGIMSELKVKNVNIEEAVTLIAPPDSDDGQNQGAFMNFEFYWGGYVVSKNVKEPMRLLKILDYMFSEEGQKLLTYGIKDVHYTEDANGVITPNLEKRKTESRSWGGNGGLSADDVVSGRHDLGMQLYACPFKVVDGKMVENYPKYISIYETYHEWARRIANENNTRRVMKGLIPNTDISRYYAEIMDALEIYTINRITGSSKQSALEELSIKIGKKDTVLKYLNENMK